MQSRYEWACALTDRCCTALQLSNAFAENRDSLVNYDTETRQELGDVFAIAAGVVLLCRAAAVAQGFGASRIRHYDRLFSVFSRYAFKSMMVCGAYASMDAIRDRCDGLATGVAERFRHYDANPFAVMSAATELAGPEAATLPEVEALGPFRALLRRFRPSVIRSAARSS